jgi:hypothetical protein
MVLSIMVLIETGKVVETRLDMRLTFCPSQQKVRNQEGENIRRIVKLLFLNMAMMRSGPVPMGASWETDECK